MKKLSYYFGFVSIIFFAVNIFGQQKLPQITNLYLPDNFLPGNNISLNGTWKFKLNGPKEKFYKENFDDTEWESISVPSNWEMKGFEEPRYEDPEDTYALYRKSFTVPEEWKDKHVFIRFEGVSFGYELWINGNKVGKFESAFQRSEFDITKFINWNGNNTVAVYVYKVFKGSDLDYNDAWALSGIYRDVYLIAVPEVHLSDVIVITDLTKDYSKGFITCQVSENNFGNLSEGQITTQAILFDPSGKEISHLVKNEFEKEIKFEYTVDNPELWNAETPNLYELQIELLKNGMTIQLNKQKVGIRKVTIEGEVFCLNYKPIKIRGVDRHEIYPTTGRALNEEQWRQDLELMKKGNINAMRTSHYPPHPRLIELCDEYGIYVICEVPAGKGGNTKDESLRYKFLERGTATYSRDKNHPSIIIWSIGNENPYTALIDTTAKLVKSLDPTRPILIPMAEKGNVNLPEFIDILAPHYPYADKPGNGINWPASLEALGSSPLIKRPIIITEYNHSLQQSFEGLAERWAVIEKYPRLAGGCIWLWADQGLLRKVNGRKVIDSYTHPFDLERKSSTLSGDYWIDDNTILDSHGIHGMDGIVYANRKPQSDYWVTRKVYSPVIIKEKEFNARPGINEFDLTISNRYDFTNLNTVKGKWELFDDGVSLKTGPINLDINPHESKTVKLNIPLPSDISNKELNTVFSFEDMNGREIYEHTIHLLPEGKQVNFVERLNDWKNSDIKHAENEKAITVTTGKYKFTFDKTNGKIELSSTQNGKVIFNNSPVLRVGRKPAMTEFIQYDKLSLKFWKKYLLLNPTFKSYSIKNQNEELILNTRYEFVRDDKIGNNETVSADINWIFDMNGLIDVEYLLTPKNVTDYFLEFGLAFNLPGNNFDFNWLGDGPYSSFPGKTEASERGIYLLNKNDLEYEGNKSNVDLVALTNNKNGIGIVCNQSNVSCEIIGENTVLTIDTLIAGKGTKPGGRISRFLLPAKDVKELKGTFTIVPLANGDWPNLLEKCFLFNK